MDPKHLVQVFAHAAGGGGVISTGYPVAPGRVLTTKHALFPTGASGGIETRWHNLEGAARAWRPAQVAWQGTEGVDAAVLACEFPAEIEAAPYLISCAEPSHLYEWISAGFAAAGARDAEEKPVPLSGKVLPPATDPVRNGTFELGVEFAAAHAQDWQGASGSPVFVGQRILGVVASAQRPFEGRRLTATATRRLLEDEGFRVAVGYVEKWKGLQEYRSELINALSGSKEAAEGLAAEMKLDFQDTWRGDQTFTRIVVDRLLLERLDELLPRLSMAHRKLCERKLWSSAEVLRETARHAVPAVCDAADIQLGEWPTSKHMLLQLPAATVTLAEIILARADTREVRFGAGPLEPLLRIPRPSAGGEIAGLSKFENAWHKAIIDKFVVDPLAREHARHATLITMASDRLSHLAEFRKQRFYYVVEIASPEEAPGWTEVIARLRPQYPAVVFVTLLGTDPDWIRENRLQSHLELLVCAKQGGSQ